MIAVFYHIKPAGPGINTPFAVKLLGEQMSALKSCGLEEAADSLFVGINGDAKDFDLVQTSLPTKAVAIGWGPQARSELPTLFALQRWLPGHEDWSVCYFHAKGLTHPNDPLTRRWRRCMEQTVLWNWRSCLEDLRTHDSSGAHWLTHEKYGQVTTPIWGGNFWWARASFLVTLPPLPPNSKCRQDDFLAENWIGLGPRHPVVRDYSPHWPDQCSKNL